MEFNEVVKKRKSKRWYLDKEVSKDLIIKMITEASLAVSFMNHQPWEAAVVQGKKLKEIAETLDKRQKEDRSTQSIPWPSAWPGRHEKILQKMKESQKKRILPDDPIGKWMYNAPVVIFLHIHKELNEWSLLDLGSFMQTLLLSAANLGVQTVPQARMGCNNDEVAKLLNLGPERKIILGITMGYADVDHPNNQFYSPREDLQEWTTWHE